MPDWTELCAELLQSAPLVRRLLQPEHSVGRRRNARAARCCASPCTLGLVLDLRLGLARSRKHRGFAFTALVTLAVCLGANAAIFTLVDSGCCVRCRCRTRERIVVFADQFPTIDPNFSR